MKKQPLYTMILKQQYFSEEMNVPERVVYKVIELKDNVQFEVGKKLEKEVVAELCSSPYWKVTIR